MGWEVGRRTWLGGNIEEITPVYILDKKVMSARRKKKHIKPRKRSDIWYCARDVCKWTSPFPLTIRKHTPSNTSRARDIQRIDGYGRRFVRVQYDSGVLRESKAPGRRDGW